MDGRGQWTEHVPRPGVDKNRDLDATGRARLGTRRVREHRHRPGGDGVDREARAVDPVAGQGRVEVAGSDPPGVVGHPGEGGRGRVGRAAGQEVELGRELREEVADSDGTGPVRHGLEATRRGQVRRAPAVPWPAGPRHQRTG